MVRVTWQRIGTITLQNISKSTEIHKRDGLNRSTNPAAMYITTARGLLSFKKNTFVVIRCFENDLSGCILVEDSLSVSDKSR